VKTDKVGCEEDERKQMILSAVFWILKKIEDKMTGENS